MFVGGTFDENGGKESKIARQVFQSLGMADSDSLYVNGGTFNDLEALLPKVRDYQQIYWFANVDNDKPKLVKEIKRQNPASILITSKRNVDSKYSAADLVYHALSNKSNLVVEITSEKGKYFGRIIDPLGNIFQDYTSDFSQVAWSLGKRVDELSSYTRVGSKQIGPAKEIPDKENFFELIRKYGEQFHTLVHARPEAVNRFFGNASFRCERGFPSFREGDLVYVSQRDVDKRYLNKEGFVAVKLELPIQYYGDKKPSVDTPIQVQLYQYYPGINYILHGHVYIKDAPFTSSVVPCGAMEEFEEIIKLFPEKEKEDFAVNLRGHGSLLLVHDLDYLRRIPYSARPSPEVHAEYENKEEEKQK